MRTVPTQSYSRTVKEAIEGILLGDRDLSNHQIAKALNNKRLPMNMGFIGQIKTEWLAKHPVAKAQPKTMRVTVQEQMQAKSMMAQQQVQQIKNEPAKKVGLPNWGGKYSPDEAERIMRGAHKKAKESYDRNKIERLAFARKLIVTQPNHRAKWYNDSVMKQFDLKRGFMAEIEKMLAEEKSKLRSQVDEASKVVSINSDKVNISELSDPAETFNGEVVSVGQLIEEIRVKNKLVALNFTCDESGIKAHPVYPNTTDINIPRKNPQSNHLRS